MPYVGRSAVVLGLIAWAAAAAAAVDLNGDWDVSLSFGGSQCFSFTQLGTAVSVTSCGQVSVLYSGTVDLDTGVFALSGTDSCGVKTLNGTLAADGEHFSGTTSFGFFHCSIGGCGCIAFTNEPAQGVRAGCGNGVVDVGELCDLGADVAGDCCSATCQLETAGTACDADGDACTVDACDGGGSCTHVDGSAPACQDAYDCRRAKDRSTPRFAGTTALLDGPFGGGPTEIGKPLLYCSAASVNGIPARDPAKRLVCYKSRADAPMPPATPGVTDMFGSKTLSIGKRYAVCVPATN
jgi:cysteine-rich repeat protein